MSFEDFSNNSEQDPVDPFTKEIHSGERVLEFVNYLMDKRPDNIKDEKEIHLKNAEVSHDTWQKMLEELIPEERIAFECALAQGLEDFYYTHYIALYRRLGRDKKDKL